MKPQLSLFLDIMRFAAAFVVFLHHLTSRPLNSVFPWVPWGHEAVLLFFVMSGFVIAFVIDTKERDVRHYSVARLGRLYSVVLPALLLTVVADYFGRAAAPDLYASAPYDHAFLRVLVNLVFLQQSWNLTVIPLSNGPFWSLAYEFWYYVIFGASMLLTGNRRVAVVGLACLLAGPRILALFPVWLTGVVAYRLSRSWLPSQAVARLVFSLAAAALVAIVIAGNPLVSLGHEFRKAFPDDRLQVGPLRLFLGDTGDLCGDLLFGALFALLIVTVSGTVSESMTRGRAAATARYLAGSTFSLYLFHAPLLFVSAALFHVDKDSAVELAVLAFSVLACCFALAYISERQLPRYRAAVLWLLNRPRRRAEVRTRATHA
jgi:peptidoglycan/LPS O-acetylase OafA/YrhL